MSIAVKICGLTNDVAVKAVITAKADYAGFVFHPPSPRHIDVGTAAKLAALLPSSIASVLIMADPDDELIERASLHMAPDYFQLHGKETPERIRWIRREAPEIKIIKAIPVQNADDIAQAMRYVDCVDMLLFDARPPKLPDALPGGNGLVFDWALLKNRQFPLPWMLSGGLTADNVADAIRISGARAVDVSSGVERVPGIKGSALINAFIEAARNT